MAALTCAVEPLQPGLDGLDPAGRAWWQAAAGGDPQLQPGWFGDWLSTVDHAGQQPLLVTVRAGEQRLALLPLLLGADGVLRSLGNYYTTRWAPLLAAALPDDEAIGALALAWRTLRARGGWHTLDLQPWARDSRTDTLLRASLDRAGLPWASRTVFQNWTWPVAEPFETYLAGREGALRSTLKRMGRRFAARGGRLTLVDGRSPESELTAGIAAYTAVYAASWKPAEPHTGFMPALMRRAWADGSLRLGLAWLNGQAVAAQCWQVWSGHADIYKLAYDEAHQDVSPGSLLTEFLMRHAFEVDRVQVVDYLSGDDAYKRLWMRDQQPYGALEAWRQPWRGHAVRAWRSLRGAWRPAPEPTAP